MGLRIDVIKEAIEIIENSLSSKPIDHKAIREQCNLIIKYAKEIKSLHKDAT